MQKPAQTGEIYLTQAFRQFAEMSGDLCALREAEYPFRLIWANPAYYDAYRRAGKSARVGQPWTDLLTGASREDALRAMRQVAETGESYRSVNDSTAASELAPREGLPAGLTSWEWNVSPIRDEDGRVAALLSVTRDISDQMMLEQTQKHVQAILDTIPSGVIVVRGPEGRVVQANMRAAQLYGRKPDPGVLFEEHAHQIRLARPDGAPFAPDEMPLTHALTRGETVNNVEARVEHPDGSHVHLMLNAAPLRDEAGEVVGVVGALDDITALKDAEEKLTQAFLHEQRTSRMLQRALLPEVPESVGRIRVGSAYRPAFEDALVGGDFFDVFEPRPGMLGFLIGDVSGKGVRAAVWTANAKYALRAFASEDPAPARVLERLNRALSQSLDDASFVTMFYGLLDLDESTLVYCSAGHEPALWVQNDGGITELATGGAPLSVAPEGDYAQGSIRLSPGDGLFLYTDGITEARAGDEFFELARVKKVLSSSHGLSPDRAIGMLLQEVEGFSGGSLRDDVAMLFLQTRQP